MSAFLNLCAAAVNRRQGALLKQSISRNTDIILSATRTALAANSGWGGSASVPTRGYMNYTHQDRIRQNGIVKSIYFYCGGKANYESVMFQVWRINGSGYDKIGEAELLPSIVAGYNTVDISTSNINAIEGDFYGIYYAGLSGGAANGFCSGVASGGRIFYYDETPASTNYLWTSKNLYNNEPLPIQVKMSAPLIVGIGDSIMAGHPGHYSFIEMTDTTDIPNQILAQMYILDSKYVFQNMGIGSQFTTQIAARFAADVVALKPKFALIEGGVNDIAAGNVTKETFLANYTSMLNACASANIIPVVCKIFPWKSGTNLQMQTRDSWCADLKVIVNSYSKSVWVDLDPSLGIFRVGGDDGNLWDIQDAYNMDHLHFRLAGYAKAAETINTEIKKKYKLL